jgi:hypothetical protein
MPAEQDSGVNLDVIAQKFGGIRKMEGSPATAEPSIFFVFRSRAAGASVNLAQPDACRWHTGFALLAV